MAWNLYNNNVFLEPIEFSNGKTQEDIVNEVIKLIKEGNKLIFIKGACGSGKCLDKDTLIFCKPIDKKYFGNYKISELKGKEGNIFSLDNFGDIIETKFKNVRQTGKKSLFKILTRTGREITASENHPFLTINKEGLEWKPLKKLNNSRYICLPNLIKINPTAILEDNKIKILAHLITEGKCGDKTGSPKYSQDRTLNPEIRQDYENALKGVFPDGILKNESQQEVSIIFNNKDTRFGTTNKLRLFIREFGLDGGKSKDKFVPEIIFNLNKKKISLFLKIMFSCDGSIYIKKQKIKKNQLIIEYCTISYKLIKDMSLLLNQFGIHHTITSKSFRKNKRYSWRINISNKSNIKKFIEKIGFIGKKQNLALQIVKRIKPEKYTNIDKIPRVIRNYLKDKGYSYNELDRYLNYEEIEKIRKNVGFKQIRKQKLANSPRVFGQDKIDFLRTHLRKINEYINDNLISFICNENIIWDKIKSIEYIKDDETYDLEVPKYHNFIADGIITHNSAIAINIAKELGKTSIVVPIKGLQKQYEEDYTNKLYVLKDGKKLKITIIDGRNNHICPYNNTHADNKELPCTIEIKENNSKLLMRYVKHPENIESIREISRRLIAPICPYWSPIAPEEIDYNLKNAEIISYKGLKNTTFNLYKRKPGCSYYNQFDSYINSDIIVFNSKKYELENLMNRKPSTEVEIIDECDYFLDNLSNEKTINLNKLSLRVSNIPKKEEIVAEINNIISLIKQEITQEPILIKKTRVNDLLKLFLTNSLTEDQEDYDYLDRIQEIAKYFENILDETYVSLEKDILSIVTINLEKKLKEILDKNKVFVMMSGTIHSKEVLRNIFGIKDFKTVEAETKFKGQVHKTYTELEENFNYEFSKNNRGLYLKALSKCIEIANKPALVYVKAYNDLPTIQECIDYGITNIKTREDLIEEQETFRRGELIQNFKDKQHKILYSTKCSRGVDFPGDICNSIIFTKYPYPNINSLFWKVLKKEKPNAFNSFYYEKAKRDLIQIIYRGVRSEDDEVDILSPDIRVFK